MKHQSITTSDGLALAATLFEPQGEATGVVIIGSAFGVEQAFYYKFASFLCEAGYTVITFDFRGIGASNSDAQARHRLAQWGELDIEAVIAFAQTLPAGQQLHFVGHSIAGQVLGLAKGAQQLQSIQTVGSSFPHLSRWDKLGDKLKMGLFFWGLGPVLCRLSKQFPARAFGLAKHNLSSSLIDDWTRWSRSREWVFDPRFGLDVSGYGKIAAALRCYGFDDDSFAPRPAVQKLIAGYAASQCEERYLQQASSGLGPVGHFNFFREQFKSSLWQEALDWLLYSSKHTHEK